MYYDNSDSSTLCAREATSQVVEEVQTEHEGITCNLENDTLDVPKHIIHSITHILDMSHKLLANTPVACYECPSDPNRNIYLPHIAMDANQEDICPMRDKSCVPNQTHILNTSYATHEYKVVQMYYTCHSEPFTSVSNLAPTFQQSISDIGKDEILQANWNLTNHRSRRIDVNSNNDISPLLYKYPPPIT